MQFSDYVTSRALHITSDCLRLLSGSSLEDGVLTAGAASNLLRSVGRLESLWQLEQWCVGKAEYRRALARLRGAEQVLHPRAVWFDGAIMAFLALSVGAASSALLRRAETALSRVS